MSVTLLAILLALFCVAYGVGYFIAEARRDRRNQVHPYVGDVHYDAAGRRTTGGDR